LTHPDIVLLDLPLDDLGEVGLQHGDHVTHSQATEVLVAGEPLSPLQALALHGHTHHGVLPALVHRHPLSSHEGVDALLGDAREVAAVIEVLDLIEMMIVIEMVIAMMMVMMAMILMVEHDDDDDNDNDFDDHDDDVTEDDGDNDEDNNVDKEDYDDDDSDDDDYDDAAVC
jgi:hypothetical protein